MCINYCLLENLHKNYEFNYLVLKNWLQSKHKTSNVTIERFKEYLDWDTIIFTTARKYTTMLTTQKRHQIFVLSYSGQSICIVSNNFQTIIQEYLQYLPLFTN